MLQELLSEHKQILEQGGWPITTQAFVYKVNRVFSGYGPVYDVIACAYNSEAKQTRRRLAAYQPPLDKVDKGVKFAITLNAPRISYAD